ncbi:HAMP domain-containing protein [Agrobacterium tumefaciens]|uniref:ATP-binding protein n=1 Tax=Agrobacterium tumefaciens TaxID=358 RepID=UPI0012B985DE|nr:ATP-binding protein [Agrobacterium tumefaciens]MQB06932.1 HAMP domain-containing protein [Agrobacterium tumefaciens]
MRFRRLRLSTMTAITITTMLIFAVALVYYGVSWYSDTIEERVLAELSPDAAKAFSDIDRGVMPDRNQLQALIEVLPGVESAADNELLASLFFFGLLGVILCSLLGYFISRRIAAPLSELADAARRMATGDFSGGEKIKASRIVEITFLVDSFESLTQELQTMERRLKFNTMAVAHELRTPLTILQGRLHGIADDVFPLDKQAIRHLIGHVEGLGRLVDDLRTLSLAETNSLVTEMKPLDLAVECSAVAESARPLLEEAGIRLEMSLETAPVHGDPQRLKQLLLILMDNVRRYAASGESLICSTGIREGRPFITIEDKGPGFPPGIEAHGIELFWRTEPSRARKTGGTGLGLSIARAIARAHDSDLQIDPRQDGGTVVTVLFKAAT